MKVWYVLNLMLTTGMLLLYFIIIINIIMMFIMLWKGQKKIITTEHAYKIMLQSEQNFLQHYFYNNFYNNFYNSLNKQKFANATSNGRAKFAVAMMKRTVAAGNRREHNRIAIA